MGWGYSASSCCPNMSLSSAYSLCWILEMASCTALRVLPVSESSK